MTKYWHNDPKTIFNGNPNESNIYTDIDYVKKNEKWINKWLEKNVPFVTSWVRILSNVYKKLVLLQQFIFWNLENNIKNEWILI